jgi:hypothetical protein
MLFYILDKFTNWFESIWTKFEKVMKEIENRKRKKKKRRKNRKGPGATIRPSPAISPQPTPDFLLNHYLLSLYLSPTSGARVSSLTPGQKSRR